MARVAMMLHTERDAAVQHATAIISRLEELGHECVLPHADAEAVGLPGLALDEDVIGKDVDLALSLGGDGNMLRAVRAVADHGAPVLGVNFGQLGYLTEVEPRDALDAIERFFAGQHQVEERMRLEVSIEGSDGPPLHALNEAVVEKVDSGRTVRLRVDLNDDFFTTYSTDGLIVATPTGSTAYSLSARGPILDPMHRALLLTPVAPHSLFDRSLVLSPDDAVRIRVLADREAFVALDGRIACRLDVGQSVVCSAAAIPARLVSFGGKDFHRTLRTKFGLADR
ncbi:MAG: NAD(+)/NADH kinase [Acidimicrobiales bacterium]